MLRALEMSRNTLGVAAYRKRKSMQVRHNGKNTFVGDIIAEENRYSSLERRTGQKLAHTGQPC